MTRLGRWWRYSVWRWQTALAVGSLLLGLAALISAGTNLIERWDDRAQVAELKAELACRSVLGVEAANIQGEIGQATALGLVAVARGNDADLAVQADRIEQLAQRLGPALEQRSQAVERCA